jgi:MFS family permease
MKNVVELKELNEAIESSPKRHISGRSLQDKISQLKHDKFAHLSLRGKSHISLHDHSGFSLSRSHRRQPIARDWSPGRKRFTASVACISTALIGLLVGIYAGEVPSIQYYIADFNHYSILGNVFFFITLAITTFLFWPLPLLHGRKPYILAALTLAMPLLFPQAISVSMQRSPYVSTWRVMLILPRTVMGAALGFANINFMATLTDLFGASLQSRNPHQETVNNFDVRRHGGGLGVWLGIWTWCYVGSVGVGFLIGAVVINTLSPDWGFYISIVIIAAVLLLNVVTPEVRRSAYRRSVTEVRTSKDISRRLARGEVMMHRRQTGPKWWGEEFHQGVMLSLDMLRQPGFLIMSLYVAWMYGQIVLTIVVLYPF